MKMEDGFYSSLSEQLVNRATSGVLGLLSFRNQVLREHLRSVLGQVAGIKGSFLADPVFEATFGWASSGQTLAQLQRNGLLHPKLVGALGNPPKALKEDYTFERTAKPYEHQIVAWQQLITQKPPRSVLVSSGTGSGKTECFLVPILHDLAVEVEQRQNTPLTGVRAVFLYPLNALIKRQKDRLVAWSEPFNGQIRFCLYNGDTPDQGKSAWQSEVVDRRTLRANPPPILVTNATMLEYMLVRSEDKPILDQSQGTLRWIVIDEAHSYIGSQAAELTLLLRRVLHAFGCKPEDVHFVATSATLGDSSEASRQQLKGFLADVAGVPTERISVIFGSREVPKLGNPELTNERWSIETLAALNPSDRYYYLEKSAPFRQIRSQLVQQATRLQDLSHNLFQSDTASARRETLQLLDLCTQAKNQQNVPFLPLRGHLFEKTLTGLWACANSTCLGRKNTQLDADSWPFGALYLERRLECLHCGYPVFEMVQCGGCGAEHLSAMEVHTQGEEKLTARDFNFTEDEFQQELEVDDEDGDEETTDDESDSTGLPRLIVSPYHDYHHSIKLLINGQTAWSGDKGISIYTVMQEKGRFACPVCKEKEMPHQPLSLFRPIRIGAPFLLSTAIPAVLEKMPSLDDDLEPKPFQGRRLITFTDSRQGTARFASKLQHDTERDYIRSLLYHSILDLASPQNDGRILELEERAKQLSTLVGINASLQQIIDETLSELIRLKAPALPSLSWAEAEIKLLTTDGFKRWLIPTLRDLTYNQLDERSIAHLCLMREFFVRPRRQVSLESIGFLELVYPDLDAVVVPPIFQQRGVLKEDWLDLLHITIDFHIRSGKSVAIAWDMLRWMGYSGRPSLQLAPDKEKLQKSQRFWPNANRSSASQSRLIRLLAFAFSFSMDNSTHKSILNEMLIALWHGIRPLLSQTENGFHLQLEKVAHIRLVKKAWICPMTQRVLPRAFKGITPYLPKLSVDEFARCLPVEMTAPPKTMLFGSSHQDLEQWLETNSAVKSLREQGIWINVNDRIARFSHYIRTAEHSAQIEGYDLSAREDRFKKGQINVLSCSTTMEMGVDIGKLTAVAMNNVPPHPANFLQRAGRAGRRNETAALSFTLCKATPHGEAVFNNPLWPFTTRLAMPKVDLKSVPIVQRHINSLVLSTFLKKYYPEKIRALNSGWFFEQKEEQSAVYEHLINWCKSLTLEQDNLQTGIVALVRRSILFGVSVPRLISQVVEALDNVAERWRKDFDALNGQLSLLKTDAGDSIPEKAINIQITRLKEEYLLSTLASEGFLPGYGFPTDVVPFVTTTIGDLQRKSKEDREDNKSKKSGYPSRNLSVAIRDYAPGADTVVDGRVYRSAGVTLNWQLPVGLNAPPEIQSLRWVWRCNKCGSNGTRLMRPEQCLECGEKEKITRYRYIQPAGFAVDLRLEPHNDITTPQYVPFHDPLIAIEDAVWMNLASANLGRYRATSLGHIFHHSAGLNDTGYSVCLRCGRADSMFDGDIRPASLKNHKRLRGGKLNDREKDCPGNSESWAIIDGIRLGASYLTHVFELQLHNQSTGRSLDKATAYSIAVALRSGLCSLLGIEESEVGCTAFESIDKNGRSGYSICLYDTATNGAGYVVQASAMLGDIFAKALIVLECAHECDNACQACILTYDSQHHIKDLNRHLALSVLSKQFIASLTLPKAFEVFGASTKFETEPLALALSRELQILPAQEIRVYLGGDVKSWEILNWRLKSDLIRFVDAGIRVSLLIPDVAIKNITDGQKSELAALMAFCRADAYIFAQKTLLIDGFALPCCLEIGSTEASVRWACTQESELAPSPLWGGGQESAQYLWSRVDTPLKALKKEWIRLESEALHPVLESGTIELKMLSELDCSSIKFGHRAWCLIEQKIPMLIEILKGDSELLEICYTDRYVRSPLALVLLYQFLNTLQDYPMGISATTKVSIQTSELDIRNDRMPRNIQHDWKDSYDRKQVVNSLFANYGNFNWYENALRNLSHARELTLRWANGCEWVVRMDQGFGYWMPSSQTAFPFDTSGLNQAEKLKKMNFMIEGASLHHPTYWYFVKKLL